MYCENFFHSTRIALMAILGFAMAFTFSCSSGDDGNSLGYSSSSSFAISSSSARLSGGRMLIVVEQVEKRLFC